MGSIRPLVTITIILVAGAYLFVKINEGPVAPIPGATDTWQSETDVPPLGATAAVPSTADSTAPSWPPASSAAPIDSAGGALSSVTSAPPTVDVAGATEALSAVPTIPELPDMPATTVASADQPKQFGSLTYPLPQNIPVAQYPDASAADVGLSPSDPYSSTVPPAAAPQPTEQIAPAGQTVSEAIPPATNETTAAPAASSTDPPLSQNPLRQTGPPTSVPDPYAPVVSTPPPATPAAATPIEPTFAESWPAIQAALQRGELAAAHKQLSKWYNDPSLMPADAQTVETLLSQLAGTVVYSTEHQLKPAHVVKPGETLETIAREHNVPWQLLAKINGIAAVDEVQPGQQIKVVPGPFSAVVDLRRSQLTLMVDGRYAGKFPVKVAEGSTLKDGEWVVQGKPVIPYQPAPTGVSRQLFLAQAETASAQATGRLVIGSQPASEPSFERIGPDGKIVGGAVPYVAVSPADAEELADILSVGSRVTIRR